VTVKLRAHHLLCMLTYVGQGYSPAFTANFDAVVARLRAGEVVQLHEGPDDICQPLLGTEAPHCLGAGACERDALAAQDVARLLGRPVQPGDTIALDAAQLDALRAAFRSGEARSACTDCQWSALCTTVAEDGFVATTLRS
jgi:uncharacterized protein